MKKFTFILLAITMSILGFAQQAKFDMSKVQTPLNPDNFVNDAKSAWFGGGFNSYWTGSQVDDQFFIVGSAFDEATVGDQITKVKFYHVLGDVEFTGGSVVTFDNTQYTIRIYENPTLAGAGAASGLYDTPIGTPVYSETVTLSAAESGTIYEHTLGTAYTINSNEFFVSISFDNGLGAMRLGGPDTAYEDVYYMYYLSEGVTYCTTTEFQNGFMSLGLGLYVDDGGAYVEQSDLAAKFLDVYPSPTAYVTTKTITETEDLVLYPIFENAGPDATSANAMYSATINGAELIPATEFDLTTAPLDPEYFTTIFDDAAYTLTVAELDALSLPITFDVCFTVTYNGEDPVTSNNTGCITVTRGEATSTECDLEMIFMTSNTDPTPIPSTLAITATDDVTVFPAVMNNGPDDANTTATVAFTIDGTPVAAPQSIDLTGLTSGSLSPLTAAGQIITAANMDAMGLTGTFDVCMSITYDGIDNVTDNNETCVTVTRDPVNVENNIAAAISVFPNPANNVITVANAENENIVILNMLGEVVANISNASSNQAIDISNLSNGTYFVKVNSEVFKINLVK
ncbi:MAG: T9SS type A sorting domain-containing protein [Bacteroidales bacterium]|nr:T9SS type A sorting domain-containing protein [Bacteroidales bacterium]